MTLAERLAQLRASAGKEGKAVAEALGVTPSVISKWERRERIPSAETLRDLARYFQLTVEEASELLDIAEHERTRRPLRRRSRNEFKRCQENLLASETEAKLIRQYENILVPAALQTPQFTRIVLESAGLPADEVDELRELRMKRADLLYDRDHKFDFLIDQAVLERLWAAGGGQDHLLGDPERTPVVLERPIAHAQIRHIVNISGYEHRNVRIRILPRQQIGRLTMFGGFRIYDDRAVSLETRTDLVWTTDLAKVREYIDDFQLAWEHTAPDPSVWNAEYFKGQSTSELLEVYFREITEHLSSGSNPRSSPANRS